jgi:hypothetical protein
MNVQEGILKIRALFEDMPSDIVPAQDTKLEAIEYSLEDGSKVMIDKLEVGGLVTLADGSAAPQGEHILADGTSIQVDDKGSIIEIESPEEDMIPEEAPAEDMQKEKMAELQAEFQAKIDILQLEKELLNEKLKSLTEKTTQGFSQVLSLIEDMAKLPTADPIEVKQTFKFEKTNDLKFERLEKYRNAILNNKN